MERIWENPGSKPTFMKKIVWKATLEGSAQLCKRTRHKYLYLKVQRKHNLFKYK